IGFLPPLAPSEAEAYWRAVLGPGVLLWVAERDGRVVGSAQLHLCPRQNGRHRAEVAKVDGPPRCPASGRRPSIDGRGRGRRAPRSAVAADPRHARGRPVERAVPIARLRAVRDRAALRPLGQRRPRRDRLLLQGALTPSLYPSPGISARRVAARL